MSCYCAELGPDKPCGWCDGPDREPVNAGLITEPVKPLVQPGLVEFSDFAERVRQLRADVVQLVQQRKMRD